MNDQTAQTHRDRLAATLSAVGPLAPAEKTAAAPIPSHLRGEPVRTVRVSETLWTATTERAKADGIPVSALIRDALDAYLDRRP